MNIPQADDSPSAAMERNGHWVFSQEFPADIVVQVGEANFSLHKFMLVAKSNYISKLVVDSEDAELTRIDLLDIPGGPEMFEKAAKFCYGVNFEITVNNVAALRCAAGYLQMTNHSCDNNLIDRTDDFLSKVALSSLSGAIVVLKTCKDLLPVAEDLKIVQRCVDRVISEACEEVNFSCRSPVSWWMEELSILNIEFFGKIIDAMKQRGAKSVTIASAIITYTERELRYLMGDHSEDDSDTRDEQRGLLESIVVILPIDKAAFPINFLCCLLRSAIYLKASTDCKNKIEKLIVVILEHATVDDLLLLSFTYDRKRMLELDSVRRIISGFIEMEKNTSVFNGGDYRNSISAAMQRVVETVDAYLGEVACFDKLSLSKFVLIPNLVPKSARKVDDNLYRAIDIYLKYHPHLDEIEREKACSVMDPLKLSYEARIHASQNDRLPLKIVLHALYYDQLQIRSGMEDKKATDAVSMRRQLQADTSLVKENEELRSQVMKMKMFISDMQKNQRATTSKSSGSSGNTMKVTFFSSMSKALGKLNPFRHTSNIEDAVDITTPRLRRFSIS